LLAFFTFLESLEFLEYPGTKLGDGKLDQGANYVKGHPQKNKLFTIKSCFFNSEKKLTELGFIYLA
jgi:hypothetical protein